jgi:hypothetical protein
MSAFECSRCGTKEPGVYIGNVCLACHRSEEEGLVSAPARQPTPQPAPRPSNAPASWDLVVTDMMKRDQFGALKYGTRLKAGTGRDALQDAYEESLDLCVYLRTAIFERDGK